jgi:hypothetical protein
MAQLVLGFGAEMLQPFEEQLADLLLVHRAPPLLIARLVGETIP